MYSGVSGLFLDALRSGGVQPYGYVEAWYQGARLTMPDGSTHLPLKVDGQNVVSVDGSTPGSRRVLRLTLAREAGLWDALAPVGTELRAYTSIKNLKGASKAVPQGVFDVDDQVLGYSPSGDLQITAPDRWMRLVRARFLSPRAASVGVTNRAQIVSLIQDAMPGVSVSDEATSTATVPAQTWDKDRAGAIEDLAKAASLDVFFDRSGTPVIRDVPTLQDTWVWDVSAGLGGVLTDAQRQRSRQRTYNIVVVTTSRNDGVAPFAPVYVWDANPASPTFAGTGSGASTTPPDAATAGPLGQRPFFYDSPLLTSTAQAIAAGQTILSRVSGLAAQWSLSSVSNSALDDGDTVRVIVKHDGVWTPERHIVDSMSVPLVWHRSPMSIQTRSTVADLPES